MPNRPFLPPQDLQDDIEIADAIESCAESYGTLSDTSIRIVKEQYSVFEIVRHIEKRRINISPDFQRYSVWSDLQRSELIETILLEIPIPMLYLFENELGEKQIIDGKQRLTALHDYISGKFTLSKLKLLPEYIGKSFNQLPPILQARIEDCQLQIYVVKPPTPDNVKFYIFDRINRGGTQLNQQEMRHALHQGKSTKLLQSIASDERVSYFGIAKHDSSRMQKEYMILRFLSFYLYSTGFIHVNDDFSNDINELHSHVMKFLNGCDDQFIEQLRLHTIWSFYYVFITLGERAFQSIGSNSRTVISLFEIILHVFSNNDVRKKIEEGLKDRIVDIVDDYKIQVKSNKMLFSDNKTVSNSYNRTQFANEIIESIKHA
ncbi:DUF262 domain-containing protein [Moritella sp.]|uniref:DUF262 domain-containing protein n=1 Tax=Moritella sp. TaxID=78556 RepID=UPI001D1DA34C|nr:DUF262 domain-containing protein [Moritella sp.]MCJ8349182.1 DUF262 domain-containing protein [Moritella sp.]NQZ39470.1 DUF262 domain-containing protein [Moritella sp.]